MVSLGDDSRRSGGFFFDQTDNSIQSHDSDDPLLSDHTTLSADIDPPFRRIKTTWVIVLQIILLLVLGTGSYVVPVLCGEKKCGGNVSGFSILAYSHGGLWAVFTAIDRYLRYHHYISRTLGYLEFYRKTRHVRRLPVTIHSGANAVLVVVLIALEQYCDEKTETCGSLKRHNFLQILITLEVAVILPILILYLVRTVKFNQKAASPDVNQDEMMTSFLQSRSLSTEIGYRDEDYVEQVLEKQADMIRYLKQHNAHLGKKILSIAAEVNRLKSTYEVRLS